MRASSGGRRRTTAATKQAKATALADDTGNKSKQNNKKWRMGLVVVKKISEKMRRRKKKTPAEAKAPPTPPRSGAAELHTPPTLLAPKTPRSKVSVAILEEEGEDPKTLSPIPCNITEAEDDPSMLYITPPRSFASDFDFPLRCNDLAASPPSSCNAKKNRTALVPVLPSSRVNSSRSTGPVDLDVTVSPDNSFELLHCNLLSALEGEEKGQNTSLNSSEEHRNILKLIDAEFSGTTNGDDGPEQVDQLQQQSPMLREAEGKVLSPARIEKNRNSLDVPKLVKDNLQIEPIDDSGLQNSIMKPQELLSKFATSRTAMMEDKQDEDSVSVDSSVASSWCPSQKQTEAKLMQAENKKAVLSASADESKVFQASFAKNKGVPDDALANEMMISSGTDMKNKVTEEVADGENCIDVGTAVKVTLLSRSLSPDSLAESSLVPWLNMSQSKSTMSRAAITEEEQDDDSVSAGSSVASSGHRKQMKATLLAAENMETVLDASADESKVFQPLFAKKNDVSDMIISSGTDMKKKITKEAADGKDFTAAGTPNQELSKMNAIEVAPMSGSLSHDSLAEHSLAPLLNSSGLISLAEESQAANCEDSTEAGGFSTELSKKNAIELPLLSGTLSPHSSAEYSFVPLLNMSSPTSSAEDSQLPTFQEEGELISTDRVSLLRTIHSSDEEELISWVERPYFQNINVSDKEGLVSSNDQRSYQNINSSAEGGLNSSDEVELRNSDWSDIDSMDEIQLLPLEDERSRERLSLISEEFNTTLSLLIPPAERFKESQPPPGKCSFECRKPSKSSSTLADIAEENISQRVGSFFDITADPVVSLAQKMPAVGDGDHCNYHVHFFEGAAEVEMQVSAHGDPLTPKEAQDTSSSGSTSIPSPSNLLHLRDSRANRPPPQQRQCANSPAFRPKLPNVTIPAAYSSPYGDNSKLVGRPATPSQSLQSANRVALLRSHFDRDLATKHGQRINGSTPALLARDTAVYPDAPVCGRVERCSVQLNKANVHKSDSSGSAQNKRQGASRTLNGFSGEDESLRNLISVPIDDSDTLLPGPRVEKSSYAGRLNKVNTMDVPQGQVSKRCSQMESSWSFTPPLSAKTSTNIIVQKAHVDISSSADNFAEKSIGSPHTSSNKKLARKKEPIVVETVTSGDDDESACDVPANDSSSASTLFPNVPTKRATAATSKTPLAASRSKESKVKASSPNKNVTKEVPEEPEPTLGELFEMVAETFSPWNLHHLWDDSPWPSDAPREQKQPEKETHRAIRTVLSDEEIDMTAVECMLRDDCESPNYHRDSHDLSIQDDDSKASKPTEPVTPSKTALRSINGSEESSPGCVSDFP